MYCQVDIVKPFNTWLTILTCLYAEVLKNYYRSETSIFLTGVCMCGGGGGGGGGGEGGNVFENNFTCLHHRTAHFHCSVKNIERGTLSKLSLSGALYRLFAPDALTHKSTSAFNHVGTYNAFVIYSRFQTKYDSFHDYKR